MNSMNKFAAADGKREDEKIKSCSPEHGHCAENVVKNDADLYRSNRDWRTTVMCNVYALRIVMTCHD